jgi:hypothetical protein
MFNQGSGHHPLVLLGAAIFLVGFIYFAFIKNPQILTQSRKKVVPAGNIKVINTVENSKLVRNVDPEGSSWYRG